MKYLLRVYLFNTFGLWLASQIIPTIAIVGDWRVILSAGLILSLLMLVVSPILKILFIPINILTFGLLSWIINVILLYLLTLFVSEVSVHSWNFPGFSWSGFVIPSAHLSYTVSLIVSSLVITFITNLLYGVSES